MIDNKTINLLRSLDEKELRLFKAHLRRHVSIEKLSFKIFLYFQKKHHLLSSKPELFQLEVMFKKILKKDITKGQKKVFQNASSDLYQSLVQFLLYASLEENSFEKDMMVIRILQSRKQYQSAGLLIARSVQRIEDSSFQDIWHPLQKLQLYHLAYYNSQIKSEKETNSLLVKCMSTLDEAFALLKINLSSEVVNRQSVLPESFSVPLLEEIRSMDLHKSSEYKQIYSLYNLCFDLSTGDDGAVFKKLHQLLIDYSDCLLQRDQLVAYTVINNFVIRQLRNGKEHYREKLFKIYKSGFANGVYVYQGLVPEITFLNAINIACRFKAFDWSRNLIDKFGGLLPVEIRADAVNLSVANIAFEEKRYSDTLSHLNDVTFQGLHYALRSKSLILRTYYELKEDQELILSFCRSFKAFVQDEQFYSRSALDGYLVLIKYVRILVRRERKYSKQELIEQVNQEASFYFQNWLVKKINLLKK